MKYLFFITTFIAMVVIISCNTNSKYKKAVATDSLSNKRFTKKKNGTLFYIPKIDFKDVKSIEILSFDKELELDKANEDNSICQSWNLSLNQMKNVLKGFKTLTSERQHLFYASYPCRIIGKIKIDGIEYKYWLGAGATLTLKNSDTTMYFGCADKICKKYFISSELTEKELKQ